MIFAIRTGLIRSGSMITLAAILMVNPAPVIGAQYASAIGSQTEVVAPPAPDADALAAEMRVLAAKPNDVTALITAGELALKLGDPTAAARFFARADKIDSRNGRLKAGTARTLLALERPGEALRLFADAEMLGYEPRNYAADRGLAFDLVGEQARAQRDYRLALKQTPDDETTRRYALSLGISGQKEQALGQIDGLLRQSDRSAWRVRAFVLAMAGDTAGAEKIATSMLPGGMAASLQPFFARLPTLAPADRAFAVHFGEVAPTPARLADARLTPSFAPLPVDAPPVRVAVAEPMTVKERRAADDRGRRQRGRAKPVTLAATGVAAVLPPVAAASPLPPPPRPAERVASTAMVQPLPVETRPTPAPTRVPTPTRAPTPTPTRSPPPRASALTLAATPTLKPAAGAPPSLLPIAVPKPTPSLVQLLSLPPSPAPRVELAALAVVSASTSIPVEPVASAPQTPGDGAPVPAPISEPPPAPRPVAAEQSILAKIVASIGVPASELGVTPIRPVPIKQAETDAPTDEPKKAAPDPAAPAPAKPANQPQVAVKPVEKPTPEKPVTDKKAAARAAAEKKAADKKTADAKLAAKEAADKAAAEKKAAKAEPSRIWVQVAGGASVADLPRAWAGLRAKAGAVLQGKQAWTTPLRFTNRLLTGPFKSGDEAQAFVNQLTKSGLTGFVFTSDQGQKIIKLPAQ